MPCILKIRVMGARDLPIMDRTSELADAYVELKFSDFEPQRTQICRKTLNSNWNEDFRFEISDDSDLQNEPLELKVLDYDAVTADDPIGVVNIDINTMLFSKSSVNGWFPIYDTLKGIRGELHVIVKLQFFGDNNFLKDSHLGVLVFCSQNVPATYKMVNLIGFVDVLINDQDPEYHWSDSFRTPRSSNEARQRLLYRLAGNMKRLVSKKVLEMGGNAVIGYQQFFDLEQNAHAITARALGTACKLLPTNPVKLGSPLLSPQFTRLELTPTEVAASSEPDTMEQAKEDSELSSLLDEAIDKVTKNPEQLFLTLKIFPPNTILQIGGVVSAKVVKLLDAYDRNVRDSWWTELREEIKSHARHLGCPHVIGYSETVTIFRETCVLSAFGTAAILDLSAFATIENSSLTSPLFPRFMEDKRSLPEVIKRQKRRKNFGCYQAHIPYKSRSAPFPMNFIKCKTCKRRFVPEVLFATIDPPPDLKTVGESVLLNAFVCRSKRKEQGGANATLISDPLPFLEYDIHRQLMYKLRVYGCNAIFGLKLQVSVGETLISATASGTAFHLPCFPLLPSIQISRNIRIVDDEDRKLVDLQNKIMSVSESNRSMIENIVHGYEVLEDSGSESESSSSSDSSGTERHRVIVQIDDDADEDIIAVLLNPSCPRNFQLCNIEIAPSILDEMEMKEGTIGLLLHQQMITIIKESTIKSVTHHPNRQVKDIFHDLIYELIYTVIHFKRCVLSGMNFEIQHPRDNDIRIQLTAVAIGVLEQSVIKSPFSSMSQLFERVSLPQPSIEKNRAMSLESIPDEEEVQHEGPIDPKNSLEDMETQKKSVEKRKEGRRLSRLNSISPVEDDEEDDNDSIVSDTSSNSPINMMPEMATALQNLIRHVEITPLSYIAGVSVEKFLGHLSLNFIKEEAAAGESGENVFLRTFMMETHAIVRSHVLALGGNGLVSYKLTQTLVNEKNLAYALVNVQGDIVSVEYENRQAQEKWIPLTYQYTQ